MADKSTALVGSSAIYVLMGSIRLLAGKYCSKLWRDISRKKTLLVIFFDAEILSKPIVPKSPASSPEERLRIKVFRESGFYYPKIGNICGCHHSNVFGVSKYFEKAGSLRERQRVGCLKKVNEKRERFVRRVARSSRFSNWNNKTQP